MADKGPGSAGRSSTKRLAKAKIKPTEHGIKSSKGRKVEEEVITKAEQQRQRKQRITAIAIGIFAVIMALSMTLPSLTYIFGSPEERRQAEEAAEAQAEAEAAAATDDEAEADDTTEQPTGMDAVDAAYKAVVDPLEAKLKENKKDLATLLNLGNDYMAWGSEASSYATDEASSEHVHELYAQAIAYFDRYLELNESSAVWVNRAMVVAYDGDFDAAIAALQELTEKDSGYAPAWTNLGRLLEYQNRTDEAKDAYKAAIEADPDDEYGTKAYANRRLAAIAAAENGGELGTTDMTEPTGTTSDVEGATALENAMKNSN